MGAISLQAFADSLGVSRITVWKALNNRPGVSDELRRKILDQAAQQGIIEAKRNRMLSVAVARPDSSPFWTRIIHYMAKELSRNEVDLLYTYLPGSIRPDYVLPASLRDASGVVVLNVYDEKLLRLLAQMDIPKVFLDHVPSVPFSQLNGDLLLLEGRSSVAEITRRLLESGRRRLGFIGDIQYAQTNLDRYLGFCDAHRALGLAPDEAFLRTQPIPIDSESYSRQIGAWIDGMRELPDAIVCVSDYVAHLVQLRLQETDRPLPPGFVLTGFDNSSEHENIAGKITTVDVHSKALGQRLAWRLLFLVDHPYAGRETGSIATDVVFRGDLARPV